MRPVSDLTRRVEPFKVISDYIPSGDQPTAIANLVNRLVKGEQDVVLLGATGTGKSATTAWLIEQVQRPTLVIAPNKTLAAQLANEFKELLPKNAVEYFVSYYDYYQPEAYVPQTDTFIEKDSSVNDEVERLRHSATNSLLTRRDVVVVATVSCIYGLGTPQEYVDRMVRLKVGDLIDRNQLLRKFVDIQYKRNDIAFERGTFRVRGDTIEIIPMYEELALRIEMFGDEIEKIMTLHPLTGEIVRDESEMYVFPATHYAAGPETMERAIKEIEKIAKGVMGQGVKSGFKELDALTNGFHPGNMIVLAARPAVGKSTLGLDIARHASIHNRETSVIFSLEMSRSEITMRMLAAEARVPLNNIRSGRLGEEEWSKMARRMGEISDAPMFIDDSANLSLMEIRAKSRRLKQRHNLKLVIIDYLQLMTSGKRVENRQQEVSEFSRSLKLLAKELNVPVVAISQLNRSPEQRSDKKPMLSDLRESGSIEQDADVVILLHREDLYDSQNRSGEADLIVAKHRNGPTRTITVSAQLHLARFTDRAANFAPSEKFIKDN